MLQMKATIPVNGLQCLTLALVAAALAGCGTPIKTADPTAISLRKASNNVQAESRALNSTVRALHDLANNPASDLRPQFKFFSASLDRLIASVERTDKAVSRLREQRDAYFQAWDRELASMNYEIIRNQSEARKAAVSNQLDSVGQRYEEIQAVVRPLIDYFGDIQRAVGTDLTLDGLTASKDIVGRATENSRKVELAMEQLAGELSKYGNRLSSIAAASPKPAAEPHRKGPPVEAGLR